MCLPLAKKYKRCWTNHRRRPDRLTRCVTKTREKKQVKSGCLIEKEEKARRKPPHVHARLVRNAPLCARDLRVLDRRARAHTSTQPNARCVQAVRLVSRESGVAHTTVALQQPHNPTSPPSRWRSASAFSKCGHAQSNAVPIEARVYRCSMLACSVTTPRQGPPPSMVVQMLKPPEPSREPRARKQKKHVEIACWLARVLGFSGSGLTLKNSTS